jgi:hypothetical protein
MLCKAHSHASRSVCVGSVLQSRLPTGSLGLPRVVLALVAGGILHGLGKGDMLGRRTICFRGE